MPGPRRLRSRDRRAARSPLAADARQPLEPARQVPVPLAEQLHHGRQQHRANDGRVDQDRRREAEAHLLDVDLVQRHEDREHRDHHERRARHRRRGALDARRDRLLRRHAAVDELLDPAEDEHVVVHREAEQHDEQEERQPGGDRAVRVEPQHPLRPGVLEDEHEQAVGGADGEQVQQHCLDRDHDRPERHEQQHEAEQEHEAEDERRVDSICWLKSCVPAVSPVIGATTPGTEPDGRRDRSSCVASRAPRPRRRCHRCRSAGCRRPPPSWTG